MINFSLNINNPFTTRWNILWNKSAVLIGYKALEFNGYETNQIINIDFESSFRRDHAGIRVMLGLFGYSIEFHLYDTRHWDYKNNRWEPQDEYLP
jgi:hypothetical protein